MENKTSAKKSLNGIFALLCVLKGGLLVVTLFLGDFLRLLTGVSNKEFASFAQILNSYDNLAGLLFNISLSVLIIGIPVLFYFALKDKNETKDEILSRKPSLMQVGASLGLVVVFTNVFSYIANVIIQVVLLIFGFELPYIELSVPTNAWLIPLFVFAISIFPAFSEEYIIRGALLGKLKSYGIGYAVFISALVFSMLHNTILQLPFAFAAGLAIGYFVIKFQSIWVGVLVHFFINLNSVIIQLIMSSFNGKDAFFAFLAYFIFSSSLVISLAIAGLILYGIKIPKLYKTEKQHKKGRWKLVFTSPFFYVFVALFFGMLYINFLQLV